VPTLAGFQDPILAAIWRQSERHDLLLKLPEGTDGNVLEIGSDTYIYFYQSVYGFVERPLIAGVYFKRGEIGQEVRRMIVSLSVGLGALLLSVIAAIVIGRRIAHLIVRFSTAAGRIQDLEIGKIDELRGSVFGELNDQSKSFNAMLRALRWFEFYVPKKIV